ncbi:tetratricopeptide repeat-containing sulfotransferase family protein [Noviluteimonas gilva]|uniref:Uncharacterized protein n=1 Tax=Noviluteimonas gilva TaxID=2682097 RepID=A0A7C9HMB6_9GAMM|nr:sulfotransferase [Lysobacter gilvus]MUV14352.1 hypothetical protein [Lysobacter gilvus]
MEPQSLQAWQTAERLLNAQQTAQAREAYAALAEDPEMAPMAHLRLSLINGREGRLRDATHHALKAWEARQSDADLLDMIAKRLYAVGEMELAASVATYDSVLTAGTPTIHADLGKLMSFAYLPKQALQLAQRALELGMETAPIHHLIGTSLQQTGDLDGAEGEFEAALAAHPDYAHAAWALATLRNWTHANNHVERLRADVARVGEAHAESALFHYALFKELDDLGEYAQAWPMLETALRLRRATMRYDNADTQALFAYLGTLDAGTSTFEPREGDPTPIFIVGMPRSGQTLLEQSLGAHSQVAAGGELREFTQQLRWMVDRQGPPQPDVWLAKGAANIDFAELGRRYLDHVRWHTQDKPYFTDALPVNALNVGFIARALPHAKFLHVTRDPMDTCFSSLKEHFPGFYGHTYDQGEMAEYYKGYRQLMAHWRRLYPDRIHDVRYGELTIDPRRVAEDVLEFLSLPWEDGVVQEAPRAKGKGAWRNYEGQLAPLKKALGSYGYSARD